MKLMVIGDYETVLGFRLVGVQGAMAGGREEALEALQRVLATPDVGVVLMTETLAKSVRDEFEARLYGHGFPLLLEVPDALGPAPDRLSVEDVVRKAIGMSL
ncbi:MAG TPA: V-type ATP synthase subunit F [Candidatus Hydrogenedentes bacterium]|nr:V-type ATP synthase subunit F [Candidatus Hydrogenedentota bacterium]